MGINRISESVDIFPDALSVLECLQERHPFAVKATNGDLDGKSTVQLCAIIDRQRKILGDANYSRLVGLHTANVESGLDESTVINRTMHEFAWATASAQRTEGMQSVDWCNHFVFETESLVYGPATGVNAIE